jgi:hypothetical protein
MSLHNIRSFPVKQDRFLIVQRQRKRKYSVWHDYIVYYPDQLSGALEFLKNTLATVNPEYSFRLIERETREIEISFNEDAAPK